MTSPRSRSLLLAASAALVLCALPRSAHACDCAFEPWVLPTSSTKGVPSNTRIWADGRYAESCTQPTLTSAAGVVVDLAVGRVARAGTRFAELLVLTPARELAVGETYTLDGCTIHAAPSAMSFQVTAGPDTTPPGVPSLAIGDSTTGEASSCGATEYWSATLRQDGHLALLDVAGRASWDGATGTGAAVDVFTNPTGAATSTPIRIGQTSCASNWSFDDDGDATGVRVASLDLAGNFSGWSEAHDLDAPGCGCAVPGRAAGPGAAGAIALSIGVLAAAARRRARRA